MTADLAALPRVDREHVLASDYGRLRGRARKLADIRVDGTDPRSLALAQEIALSAAKVDARRALVPAITLDESLPITAEAGRIVELIRKHPVLVVAGETGSGKTTQLPKLCLAAGRGVRGLVGCTQPRRIAARAMAKRVAQELGIADLVGFQVRFTEQVSERALVKFMTDGILLAEIQSDPWLSRYDTIIVDEAHERSLNIDFLLGYLKQLVQRRPDLRVVVTSATIDTERFARHFGGAPVLSVEGRAYPVEVRWRPPEEEKGKGGQSPFSATSGLAQSLRKRGSDPLSLFPPPSGDPLLDGVIGVMDEISRHDPLGDVLVFLPGEREIRDLHLALERRRYRETEILPLYARLSAKDQDRVFNPGPKRRVVLATNVAETSITVPRIRTVIDPGLARVNRYSHRHKVQRLHVEKVSQASADQRKGRCGRVGPGICYRLYDEADFNNRQPYTDPELLRSSLAGVILRLMSLRLGSIEAFEFLDPPEDRAIADGYQQLVELGAITPDRRQLTGIGRTLARLPIDVKLARMLVEAEALGVLDDVLAVAAFLSIQDPRERPAAVRELADSAHAHYADPRSDFVAILNLWREHQRAHEDLTQSRLREWCNTRFLSFLRMREWRELHRQLLLLTEELGWRHGRGRAEPGAAASSDAKPAQSRRAEQLRYELLHRALLAGLPGQVARREENKEYAGTRGRRYLLFPGSGIAKKPPAWVLSATLLDTQRLYGLTNAEVEPAWIEQQAPHLVRKRHFDPHWARSQGRVLGYESVSLFGLVIIEKRRVAYGSIDPVAAREVFLREALLTGEIDCHAAFVARNLAVLEAARTEEEKRRRHGLVRGDDELVAWLDARIPQDMCTTVALDAWYRRLDGTQKRALEWSADDVLEAEASPARAFPTSIPIAGHEVALEYRFEPGHAADGVTLVLPLKLLNAVPDARLSWLVPGLLVEKVSELIRALPKPLRRNFVPAPDFAQAFVRKVSEGEDARGIGEPPADPLPRMLTRTLSAMTGVDVPAEEWRETDLPAHLRFNVRLLDEQGDTLASSRDLAELKSRYGTRARAQFARETATALAREGLRRWDFESLPESIVADTGLAAYPALVDQGEDVAIEVFESQPPALAAHARGVRRLLALALAEKLRGSRRNLPLSPKVAIAYTAIDSPDQLREDVALAAFDDLARDRCAPVRTRTAFEALVNEVSKSLGPHAVRRLALIEEVLVAYAELAPKLHPPLMGFARANYDDLRAQLVRLVHPGFARALPLARLAELPRYLKAMSLRVERLVLDPRKDQQRMLEVRTFVDALESLEQSRATADAAPDPDLDLERLRWAIEEYRVQVFAQELGTKETVSDKRLRKLLQSLQAL